ncbi:MAG: hypothetical protein M1834_003559 [Cirrosporium novae-zelandiae]|nr:MAG: hypothetical protein M1834_003559 [Cirrosporium novae-zelandiae]
MPIFTSLFSIPLRTSILQLTPKRSAITLRFLRMASTLPRLPVFEAIANHDPQHTAIIHSNSGRSFKYGNILQDVAAAKDKLNRKASDKLEGQRIAFLVENGCNAIAIPMSPNFPPGELRYIMQQSGALMLLSSDKFKDKANDVLKEGLEREVVYDLVEKQMGEERVAEQVHLENLNFDKSGMMLYTSGTTNRPKGVLLPESVLTAQARSLMKAWNYTPKDHLLHVLPLHHIHGTINAIMTPLLAGSTIEFLFPFNLNAVWNRFAAPFLPNGSPKKSPITFFTAVPTIYNRLLPSHSSLSPELQEATRKAISPEHLRLNISGSAALPTPTKAAWKELSNGNVLLERYGMTEVGMALSCGLSFDDRVDGSVGWALPSVQVRLVDTESNEVIKEGEELTSEGKEREGEIQLRGPTIFREYWNNLEATMKEHTEDKDGQGKWFKTGDVATRKFVQGVGKSEQGWTKGPMYFIRGRRSVDIIKSGGEKVSALEIERELLSLPQIAEAAVVGLPSEQWGQKVAAVIVLKPDQVNTGRGGKQWGIMDMRRALKDQLANYKIPQEMKVVESIPKNAMGKSKLTLFS